MTARRRPPFWKESMDRVRWRASRFRAGMTKVISAISKGFILAKIAKMLYICKIKNASAACTTFSG
jgi:hypothetical protein